MPVSALQHRSSVGAQYQKSCGTSRGNSTRFIQRVKSDDFATLNEITRLGSSINHAVNFNNQFNPPPVLHQGITAQLLMLLSLVRLVDSPFCRDTLASVVDRDNGLSPLASQNTANSDNSGTYSNHVLSPVFNVLYETSQFISRHDPLKLPGADALALPADSQVISYGSSPTLPEATNPLNNRLNHAIAAVHLFYMTIKDEKLSATLIKLIQQNRPSREKKDENLIINEMREYIDIISKYMYENKNLSAIKLAYGKLTIKKLLVFLNSLNCPETDKSQILETWATVSPLLATIKNLPEIASIIISTVTGDEKVKPKIEQILVDVNTSIDQDETESDININYILGLINEFEILSQDKESMNNKTKYEYIVQQLKRSLSLLDGDIGKYFSFIWQLEKLADNKTVVHPELTPDKRGRGYLSVEEQIATNIILSVNWYDDGYQHTAAYGLAFNARRSLLAYALAISNITNVNELPNNWYKEDNLYYLYWYSMNKLDNHTDKHGNGTIHDVANNFYDNCYKYNSIGKNNKLDIHGLRKIEFKNYNKRHKMIFLRHYLEQDIIMDQPQETIKERLYKIANIVSIFTMTNSLLNRGITLLKPSVKIRHVNSHHLKQISNRNLGIKTLSGRGNVNRSPLQDSQHVRGNIGSASYSLNKKTRNLTITTHGMPFRTSANGISSASKVSSEIKKLSDEYGNFNKISLRSCYGAKGGCFSQGQVIADKTQTSVAAYKGKYTQQGGAPHLGSGGQLKIFEPSGSHIRRKVNNFGNRVLGSPMIIVQNLISRFN